MDTSLTLGDLEGKAGSHVVEYHVRKHTVTIRGPIAALLWQRDRKTTTLARYHHDLHTFPSPELADDLQSLVNDASEWTRSQWNNESSKLYKALAKGAYFTNALEQRCEKPLSITRTTDGGIYFHTEYNDYIIGSEHLFLTIPLWTRNPQKSPSCIQKPLWDVVSQMNGFRVSSGGSA